MWLLMVIGVGCLSGFILFRKNTLTTYHEPIQGPEKLSIIIPARNEEYNLRFLLDSLQSQTLTPYEIIVVDDFSEDRTKEIAESYGVKVIANSSLLRGGRVRAGQYGMDIYRPRAIFLLFWMRIFD